MSYANKRHGVVFETYPGGVLRSLQVLLSARWATTSYERGYG